MKLSERSVRKPIFNISGIVVAHSLVSHACSGGVVSISVVTCRSHLAQHIPIVSLWFGLFLFSSLAVMAVSCYTCPPPPHLHPVFTGSAVLSLHQLLFSCEVINLHHQCLDSLGGLSCGCSGIKSLWRPSTRHFMTIISIHIIIMIQVWPSGVNISVSWLTGWWTFEKCFSLQVEPYRNTLMAVARGSGGGGWEGSCVIMLAFLVIDLV